MNKKKMAANARFLATTMKAQRGGTMPMAGSTDKPPKGKPKAPKSGLRQKVC